MTDGEGGGWITEAAVQSQIDFVKAELRRKVNEGMVALPTPEQMVQVVANAKAQAESYGLIVHEAYAEGTVIHLNVTVPILLERLKIHLVSPDEELP